MAQDTAAHGTAAQARDAGAHRTRKPSTGGAPVVIDVAGVSKRFVIRKDKSLKERVVNAGRSRRHREDFWALRDVDLTIEAGTTVGLIGPNGSGKSTLLKTIGGILQPTQGTVHRRGRLAALLELGAGFHPDLTGRENVFLNASILGLSRQQTAGFFDEIVSFSGIEAFIDTQVKFYSSGMYVRLAFAVAVHVDPDVLLVDEVLAVGDEPFQRKCMDRIRDFQAQGRTIVLVTHALDQVVDVCDRAVVLEHGRVGYDGDPAAAARYLRGEFLVQEESDRAEARSAEPDGVEATPVEVTAVRVLGPDGRVTAAVDFGRPATIEVDVTCHAPLEQAVVGVGLDSLSGQGLWGTNTKLLEVPLRLEGERTVRFELQALNAGSGQYEVHGAVATWEGRELARLPRAAQLTVAGPSGTVGTLGIVASVRA